MTPTPPKPRTSPTANAMRAAAKSIRGQDTLDRLLDATPSEALRMVRSMDEHTARTLLWAAVTGAMRKYKCPAPTPTAPVERDEALEERTRETITNILVENPGSIGAVTLALGDAVTTLCNQQRAA